MKISISKQSLLLFSLKIISNNRGIRISQSSEPMDIGHMTDMIGFHADCLGRDQIDALFITDGETLFRGHVEQARHGTTQGPVRFGYPRFGQSKDRLEKGADTEDLQNTVGVDPIVIGEQTKSIAT